MSAPPSAARANSESQTCLERAKAGVATPKAATAQNIRGPAWRRSGCLARNSAIAAAPSAGPERRSPNPVGPTASTSPAKAGSSAVTPPSSTAKWSREIAPTTIRLPQT